MGVGPGVRSRYKGNRQKQKVDSKEICKIRKEGSIDHIRHSQESDFGSFVEARYSSERGVLAASFEIRLKERLYRLSLLIGYIQK